MSAKRKIETEEDEKSSEKKTKQDLYVVAYTPTCNKYEDRILNVCATKEDAEEILLALNKNEPIKECELCTCKKTQETIKGDICKKCNHKTSDHCFKQGYITEKDQLKKGTVKHHILDSDNGMKNFQVYHFGHLEPLEYDDQFMTCKCNIHLSRYWIYSIPSGQDLKEATRVLPHRM